MQINPAILAAKGLDLEQLRSALAAITVIQPKGQLYGQQQSYLLNTNDQLETAEGFNDQIIAFRSGAPVRVRDIGRAIVGPEDITKHGWYNDKPAVVLAVQRQPGANVIDRSLGGARRCCAAALAA